LIGVGIQPLAPGEIKFRKAIFLADCRSILNILKITANTMDLSPTKFFQELNLHDFLIDKQTIKNLFTRFVR
jgi:hypothetical protein